MGKSPKLPARQNGQAKPNLECCSEVPLFLLAANLLFSSLTQRSQASSSPVATVTQLFTGFSETGKKVNLWENVDVFSLLPPLSQLPCMALMGWVRLLDQH